MKPLVVFFAVSLAANAVLATLLLLQPKPAAPRPTATTRPATTAPKTTATTPPTDAFLAALAGTDSAAMIAAGVPADVANHLAAARAFGRLAKISRTMDGPAAAGEYWRQSRQTRPPPTREQRTERYLAEREFERTMRDAFGETWNNDSHQNRYHFLSADRQEAIRRIERDYEEMQQAIGAEAGEVELASDREKRELLEQEKERDIRAALSAAEREGIERRSSPAARAIIDQFGDILASEDEYARLYALRKELDDRFNSANSPSRHDTEGQRVRAEAERKLNDELRAAIGEERWASVSRANDREYHTLGALVTRLGLPAATPDSIYAVRETYAAQSLALHQNTALTDGERKGRLASLASLARDELRAKLGPEAAEAYLPHAGWVATMQNGAAFVTQPRLLPPGSPRPAGTTSFYALPSPGPTPKR